MATYLILGKFERDAIDRQVAADGQEGLLEALANDFRVTLSEAWFTTGSYDVLIKIEANEHEDALGFTAALADIARLSTNTLTAHRTQASMIEAIRDAHTRHGDKPFG